MSEPLKPYMLSLWDWDTRARDTHYGNSMDELRLKAVESARDSYEILAVATQPFTIVDFGDVSTLRQATCEHLSTYTVKPMPTEYDFVCSGQSAMPSIYCAVCRKWLREL
jgi:hypothetical protein